MMENMPKRYTLASIEDFLPIEYPEEIGKKKIGKKPILEILEESFDWSKFDPIPVVEYNGKYIMGDGHHRTWHFYSKGKKYIPIDPLKTIEDIQACQKGVFGKREFKSMNHFLCYYHVRKLVLSKEGVHSIKDYNPKLYKKN